MAYGARLESVLGASPRGFESPILRHQTPGPVEVPGFLLPLASLVLLVVPLVFRAPSGPATVCAAGRRPARESSAPRASLGASSRSPARPRRHPSAPRPGPSKPVAPFALVALVVLCAPAGNRALTALLSPGLVPLDSEALDDLCARERSQDLARHKELRSAQARADAAPSDRARRVDEEPP